MNDKMDAAAVRIFEERAFNAWPALQTVLIDGWVVRFAEGFTKRANSASPYLPQAAPVAAIVRQVEALYGRHGLPPVFRLTPLARPGDGAGLDTRGYRHIDESAVMAAPLSPTLAHDPAVLLDGRPGPNWLAGFAAGSRHGPAILPALEKLLAAIRFPTAYVALVEDNTVHGYGLGVVERGMLGLFDILVDVNSRRRGHGRRIVTSLMAWGREQGASTAYLQVAADNAAAIRLYHGLGFREVYSYGYWLR